MTSLDPEQRRLEELRRFRVLDTPPEPEFDRVTEIAARACGTPMAIVTLVDAGRQWFKSRVGVEVSETDRAIAFCAHAIEGTGAFVVVDAWTDPRFRDNPLVTGEPHLRFYHGVPLVTRAGHALGTLAVLDREPRELDELHAELLEVLAGQVVALLEERRLRIERERHNEELAELNLTLRSLNDELREAGHRYDGLFATNPLPMMIFDDATYEIMVVNDAAVDLYGYDRDTFTTLTLFDIRPEEDVEAARTYLATPRPTLARAGLWRHRRADGTVFAVDITSHRVVHGGRDARLAVVRDVSAVEVAERAARDATERLAATFERMTDGVVTVDRAWRLTFVNPAAAEILRRPAEELLGRVLWEDYPEAVGTELESALRAAMSGADVEPFEIRWAPTDRWGEVRAYPNDDGVTVYVRDVTARRAAGERTQMTIRRLSATVTTWRALSVPADRLDHLETSIPELASAAFDADRAWWLRLDPGGELEVRSRSGDDADAHDAVATAMAGRALASDGPVAQLDPEDRRMHHVAVTVALPDDEIGVLVLRAVAGSDDLRSIDLRALELLAEAFAAASERYQVARRIRHSEERFRLVSRAATDAIYDWDLEHGTVWWNDGMMALFGWDPDDLVPRDWERLMHADDRERVTTEVGACIRDPAGTTWSGRYRFRRADGGYAWVSDRAHVVRDPNGHAVRLVGGMADVTSDVESEVSAQRSQRLEAVGELTGGVAHDFNNLLTVILGATDELVAELTDRPDQRELASMARSAALRGAELAHRLLAFARRQPLEPRSVDVGQVLTGIEELIRRTLPEDVHLELVVPDDLPSAFVDAGQLESALLNLCINARDAMPDGGRLAVVARAVQLPVDAEHEVVDGVEPIWFREDPYGVDDPLPPGTYLEVGVTDDGTGIPPEVLPRVFEPFFSTKPVGTGSGLGLSMVHGFVHQSHGRMDLQSDVGIGTSVRFLLPTAGASTGITTLLDRPSVGRPEAVPDRGDGERILLVEDEALVRSTAARHLRSLGYEVIEAVDADQAMEMLRTIGGVDLLFTDVVMPGSMSGRTLADAVRRERPGTAVLFASGYAPDAMTESGQLDDGVDLLVKPYRPAELALRVRAALDASG